MIQRQSIILLLLLVPAALAQQRVVPAPGGGDPHIAMPIDRYMGNQGDGVIDYSYAGYAANERPLPMAPVRVVVPVKTGDDTERLQAALDYVGTLPTDARGLRGAVLLQAGQYEVSGQLVIKHSGVVLRGSGADANGTILTATGHQRRPLIHVLGRADRTCGPSVAIEGHVPADAMSVTVTDAHGLKAGQHVWITRSSTEAWIKAIGMSKFWQAKKAPRIWKAGELNITWDRTIKAMHGSTVTLDAPLSMALDPNWGAGTLAPYTWPGRLKEVGIENLQLVSAYDTTRPKDEDHAWMGITMGQVRDAWVRGVTFRHFIGSAVSLWESVSRVTVVDCLSLEPVSEDGGWRRRTFFTTGQQTLFLRCFSSEGRHDFSVGHCAAGPNAFVHCNAREAHSYSGPIGCWATGVLYDNVNIDGDGLRLGNRGTDQQFCGWNAANCLLWQCTAAQLDCFKPPTAENWAIGCWGNFTGDGHWAAFNEFVNPKSLMQALVAQRVGPQAGQFIGEGVVHPPGSTRPNPQQARAMVATSNGPAPQLTEVITRSRHQVAWDVRTDGVPTLEAVLLQHPELHRPQSHPALQKLTLAKGRLWVGGRLLTGKTLETYWWRSRPMPQSIEFKRAHPALNRFVPGRVGTGWTDDLDVLTTHLAAQGYAAVFQHPGLWYDRRRVDHERVRRRTGDVWAPFDEMPFARSGQGRAWDGLSRYDLTRYNPWYFDRLKTFANDAEQKGLVLLDNDYFQHHIIEAGAHWADYPWRSANNINHTGFPEPPPYAGDKRIFQAHLFYDVNNPVRCKLHRAYMRHHLDVLSDCPNVIHMLSAEYTGPLAFTQFWLDTIGQWEQETGKHVLTALSCTYDVQEKILNDPARAKIVDIIDIRYWAPQPDGTGKGPQGGINLSPRQQKFRGSGNNRAAFRAAVKRLHQRFPEKAVICSAMGFQITD